MRGEEKIVLVVEIIVAFIVWSVLFALSIYLNLKIAIVLLICIFWIVLVGFGILIDE